MSSKSNNNKPTEKPTENPTEKPTENQSKNSIEKLKENSSEKLKEKSLNSIKSKSADDVSSKNGQDDTIDNSELIKETLSISSESMNKDYLEITAKMEKHNRCINELKRQIQEKSKKPKTIRTCIEERELNCLECCLEKELLCLRKLKQCTIEMQATNTDKPWGVIPLSTTLEEDEMPRIMLFSSGSFNQQSKLSVQSNDSPAACIQQNLIAQNVNLETNRDQLKSDLINRNKVIECLTEKLQCLHCKMVKMARNATPAKCQSCGSEKNKNSTCNVRAQLDQMSAALHQIQQELNSVKRIDRCRSEDENCYDYSTLSPAPDASLTNDYETCDYNKRQHHELCCLREKMANLTACQSAGQSNSPEQIQLEVCNRRIKELLDEQGDFKCLIVEQQKQLNDYRDKYLQAQQKVIEQKCQMDGMDVNNKRIEEQINNEMQRIKKRFQDKLEELAPLPKILENEQFRLAEMTKRNEELEVKISIICKELRQTKKELSKFIGNGSNSIALESRCATMCAELCDVKKKLEQSLCDKQCLETQLKHIQDELNTTQSQSNRLLAKTKERCETTKDNMKSRIDQLEMDLAQCRADASICLADREAVIRQMTSQLTDLSSSFDGAQRQIRNLKNRMNILSEPNKELNVSRIDCNC